MHGVQVWIGYQWPHSNVSRRTEFCWLCLKELGPIDSVGHYMRASGCTMFGKRRWSERTVKMLHLTSPITAPVAIAGVAVTAASIAVAVPIVAALDDYQSHSDNQKSARYAMCFRYHASHPVQRDAVHRGWRWTGCESAHRMSF